MIYEINYGDDQSIDFNYIRSLSPKILLLSRPEEHRYYENIIPSQGISFEDIIDFANSIGARIILTTGAYRGDLPQWDQKCRYVPVLSNVNYTLERYNSIEIQYWDTWCWLKEIKNWRENLSISDLSSEKILEEYNTFFENLFITLNNVVKEHRVAQIDTLAKYNLLEKGKFTWNSYNYQNRDINHSLKMKWEYWNPKIVLLDDSLEENNSIPIFLTKAKAGVPPKELKTSFMQIVTETSCNEISLSEKVSTPIYFGKLFLVNGAPGFHEALKKLGFVLYDELFDYEFDQEENIKKRVDLLTKNLLKYRDKSPDELKKLFNTVLEKIKFNKKHLMNVCFSLDYVPEIYKSLYENPKHKNKQWAIALNFLKNESDKNYKN